MTINPFASSSVAPTAPSRTAKLAVSASSEGFGAMVADVMVDEDDRTVASISKSPSDASPQKTSDAPREAEPSTDDASADVGHPDLSNAAALFVLQPQPPQPIADEAGNTDASETTSVTAAPVAPLAAGTELDLLQTPAPDSTVLAVASKVSVQSTSADPNVALPQMVDSETAASAIVPKENARMIPSDTMVDLPQTVEPEIERSVVAPKDTAPIAPDTKVAKAQTTDPDIALLVTTPKPPAQGAAASPHGAQPVTAETFKAPLADLAQQTPTAPKLPTDTEQAVPQTATSDNAGQTSGLAYVARAETTGLLTDAPARKTGDAFKDAVSNASAGGGKTASQPSTTSDDAKAGGSLSTGNGQASGSPTAASQASPAASPSAATSAFAAQVQAQANAIDPGVAATTDIVPTAQSQTATQANTIATAPVIASFSGLSRATLETTVQIAAQITRQLAGRSTRFEMGLTPEGLGKVNVSMDIDADGQLTARLAFDNPLAAADLRARVDELRGQLQDAGFKLADDALTFSSHNASSQDGGADQRSDQNQGRAFAAASRMADDADFLPPVPAWVSLSLTPRGVDMKV